MLIEQWQHPRGVGADEIAHAGIEAVVHMREHEIEIGLGGADGLDLADPFLLLAAREVGAVVEKSPQTRGIGIGGLKQLDGIETVEALEFVAHILVHGREAGGVGGALERFKIELGEVDAIPIEAADELFHARGNGG